MPCSGDDDVVMDGSPGSSRTAGLATRSIAVLLFGVAFGYVEAAVVVYLRHALGIAPEPVFPLQEASGLVADLARIEAGRELATLVMLATIGWVTGRTGPERLAWAAVAFGAWDIAYYGWLWVFIGWPPSLASWDVLFLVPVPWVAPVWAPVAVSVALVMVGLLAARRLRGGAGLRLGPWQRLGGFAGGGLVIGSFLVESGAVVDGSVPSSFAWPIFWAGMAVALIAARSAFAPQAVDASAGARGPRGDGD